MLPHYQLKIADFCNIPIGILFKTRIKIHYILEFNQSQWLKPYFEFKTQKRTEGKKMETKKEKHCTN